MSDAPAPPPPLPPSPWPQQGHTAPPQRRRDGLSFGQFLGRVAVVTVAAPIALTLSALALLLPFIVLIAVVAAAAGSATDVGDSTDRVGATSHLHGADGADDWVLVVPMRGIILEDGGGGLFASAVVGGYDVKRTLERAALDDRVAAVVLEINSPGGSVPGSAAIADGVELVQKAGKPVVAHVGGISASGAVYGSAPADRIIADEGSLVGSIGVIFGPWRQYTGVVAVDDGLFTGGVDTQGGVEEFYVTAGAGKDLGNPYRPMTPEERASLQAVVDLSYRGFVERVRAGRGLTTEQVQALGAYVYESGEAVERGLVDEVGSREVAYAAAAELAGVTSYDVREVDAGGGFWRGLFGLLGGGPSAPAPASDPAAVVSQLCGPSPRALALHGDPLAACAHLERLAGLTG
ncbi:MAG: S49 family peptidase [Acidimicrobiales bacterium]|nr:S49 family peptidase [Acidimicrobiales bacterium]